MTQDTFNLVKIMLKAGSVQQKEIARLAGVSTATVCRINAYGVDSLEEFRKLDVERSRRTRAKKAAKKAAEKAAEKVVEKVVEKATEKTEEKHVVEKSHVSTYQINRLIEQQNETIDLLKVISNKLVFIVEQLS